MEPQRPVYPMEKLAGFTYVTSPPGRHGEAVGFTAAAEQSIIGAGGTEEERSPTTLLLLHGTGGDEYDLLELGGHIAPTALLVSPRGRAPENGMNRWFARHAAGVLDVDDIRRRAEELRLFIRELSEKRDIAGENLWMLGFSNGANMAAAMLLLYPDVAAGAVLLRPMLPLTPDQNPDLTGKPVFIAAGRRDTMIPRESTERLIEILEESGADLTALWSDGGHQFSMEEVTEATRWYARSTPVR